MEGKIVNSKKLRQYILTGAAIGVYFGWFYRPGGEPSVVTIVGLSVLVTIVMTLLRWWRGERENLLRRSLTTFLLYTFVLAVLGARFYVLEWGGKTAVIAMTTIMGALSGYFMARKEGIKLR